MVSKILNFLKYNNFTILIVLAILLLGSGVFAQTETGQAFIGQEETKTEGVDNTLLLAADLDNLAMDFKVEKVDEDEMMYYVTYTHVDLVKNNSVWEYQLQSKVKKVSKKSNVDLGKFLAEEFSEEYLARIKDLKAAQAAAQAAGEEKRVAVTAYTGLIGQTLDLVSKTFPAYEAIKRVELPSPENFIPRQPETAADTPSSADNLTAVYNEYITENDPDKDNIFGEIDNCPDAANSNQLDSDNDGLGDACDDTPLIKGDEGGLSDEPAVEETAEPVTEEIAPVVDEGASAPAEEAPAVVDEPAVEIIDLPAVETTAAEPPTE